MEVHGFDALAKTVGRPVSRPRTIKVLAATG